MNRARIDCVGGKFLAVLALATLVAGPVALSQEQGGRAPAAVPAGDDARAACLFTPGTAIPQLAMGVLRPGDPAEAREAAELQLWAEPGPAADATPAAVRPLFVPLYVYEERSAAGGKWCLLGEAYGPKDGKPLGWADASRLHRLDSRYAYHFANPKRVPPGVQLYETKKAAYAALTPQGKDAADPNVLVAERLEEDAWDPLSSGAIPPFVELPDEDPVAGGNRLTDTTPTFPLPAENRLVRLGAVAGGPVDKEKLDGLRQQANARAGIEIAFVIDETLSMKNYFPQVANFIGKNLAGRADATDVKVAVSWYSDSDQTKDDPEPPNNPGPLRRLADNKADPAVAVVGKDQIVSEVKDHKVRIVRGDANAEELVFEGLVAAIEKASFTKDANKMVFVIGDAADRSGEEDLGKLYDKVAEFVTELDLQVAFIQVGDAANPDKEFVTQAESLQKKLPPAKHDAVVIQPVNGQSLAMRIADIQARMEAKRQVLLREIEKLESRNRYSQPGPVMERLIDKDGLTQEQFDKQNLQYFAPAYGWLYHPQQPDASPQLRELIFLAKVEEDALVAALKQVAEGIGQGGAVNADTAVEKLASVLAKNSEHPGVEQAINAAWKAMPADERTFGAFLRDKLGLRVRSAILYHRGKFTPGEATKGAADWLDKKTKAMNGDRTRTAPRAGMPAPVWRDAWDVLP